MVLFFELFIFVGIKYFCFKLIFLVILDYFDMIKKYYFNIFSNKKYFKKQQPLHYQTNSI